MYLIGCIILFVVSVEFDPTGKEFIRLGDFVEGEVSFTPGSDPLLTTEEGAIYSIRRFATYAKFRTELSPLYGYTLGAEVIPSSEIPHAPRSQEDFLVPVLWVLLSMICIAAYPKVLYVDYFAST